MAYEIIDRGLCGYQDALACQRSLWEEVRSGARADTAFICSHYPVITRGRASISANLKVEEPCIHGRGIALVNTDRGGDITYHGPGQLICYPICDLRRSADLHGFIRGLEELIIGLLDEYGMQGRRKQGLTGVWTAGGKIASIGIAVRQWVSFHGFALCVKQDDLENFSLIRPCGMDIKVTSMETELQRPVAMDEVKQSLIRRLSHDASCLAGIRTGDL